MHLYKSICVDLIIHELLLQDCYYLLGLGMWEIPQIPPQIGIGVEFGFAERVIGNGSQF